MRCLKHTTSVLSHRSHVFNKPSSTHLLQTLDFRRRSGPFRGIAVKAAQDDNRADRSSQEFGLAPAKPKTPYGQMLEYYVKMQPELFKTAVEDQLKRLKEEKEAKEAAAASKSESTADQSQLTLFKRMEEVRANEVRATLEDLMYVSILEKFVLLGVEMLPRMDGYVDAPPANLKALTEGIHSKEALELVREHLMSIMGPTGMSQFSNAMLKMSKFQMAQVYAASIMFGYFLRRVDSRFQLEKSLGTLEVSRDDAVARLERLFAQAEDVDAPWEEPLKPEERPRSSSASPPPPPPPQSTADKQGGAGERVSDWVVVGGVGADEDKNGSASAGGVPAKKQKSALRRYVESFDQAAMVETARIVSMEGGALVERQTSALLGDIKKLTQQVQEAVGNDVTSMQDVMERMAKAVQTDAVETLTMTVGTQRRAVLEAVAFGTFLRDVETVVDTEYGLLTIRAPLMLPGMDAGSSDDDE